MTDIAVRLKQFDEYLLDRIFQRIADFSADNGGPNCFGLARLCLLGLMVCSILRNFPDHVVLLAIGFVVLSVLAFSDVLCERDVSKRPMFKNMRRRYWISRILFIYFLIFTPFMFPDHFLTYVWALKTADQFVFTTYIYFASCSVRPPKPKPARVPVGATFAVQ